MDTHVARRPHLVIACTFALAFVAGGCEVKSDIGYGGGGGESSSGSVASPLMTECPSAAWDSRVATSCFTVGRVCEAGEDQDPACNPTYVCTASTAQSYLLDLQSRAACPSAVRGSAACPSPLPADGSPCEIEQGEVEGRLCPRDDGATCACTTGPDGAHAHEARWVCVKPQASAPDASRAAMPECPAKRPRLGQPCGEPVACDYGSCTFKHGMRVECVTPPYWPAQPLWLEAPAACP